MTDRPAEYSQTAFRFRFDDGSETTATWSAALNTDDTKKPYVIFRLRFAIQQTRTNANTELSQNLKLKYSLNGAAYIDVGAQGSTTSIVRYANSSNITDNEATTQQLTANPSFFAGAVDENGDTGTLNFSAPSETEVEFVLNIYGQHFTPKTRLEFRVYKTTDVALNVYNVTPVCSRTGRNIMVD